MYMYTIFSSHFQTKLGDFCDIFMSDPEPEICANAILSLILIYTIPDLPSISTVCRHLTNAIHDSRETETRVD